MSGYACFRFDDLDAQIHSHHFLDEGNQQHKAGPFGLLEASESKDQRSLVFAQDPHASPNQDEGQDQDNWGQSHEDTQDRLL